jgi:hypothetical protein
MKKEWPREVSHRNDGALLRHGGNLPGIRKSASIDPESGI